MNEPYAHVTSHRGVCSRKVSVTDVYDDEYQADKQYIPQEEYLCVFKHIRLEIVKYLTTLCVYFTVSVQYLHINLVY